MLDVLVAPDRSVTRKDDDELALALSQGAFNRDQVAAIEADAVEIEELINRWGSPFCDGWEEDYLQKVVVSATSAH